MHDLDLVIVALLNLFGQDTKGYYCCLPGM